MIFYRDIFITIYLSCCLGDLLIVPIVLLFSLCALFADPMVDKTQVGKHEGNARCVYSLQMSLFSAGWHSGHSSRRAVSSPLMADPTDTAIKQQQMSLLLRWSSYTLTPHSSL